MYQEPLSAVQPIAMVAWALPWTVAATLPTAATSLLLLDHLDGSWPWSIPSPCPGLPTAPAPCKQLWRSVLPGHCLQGQPSAQESHFTLFTAHTASSKAWCDQTIHRVNQPITSRGRDTAGGPLLLLFQSWCVCDSWTQTPAPAACCKY